MAPVTHNLRQSRQNQLGRKSPTHVTCAIMGNTPGVANRHYLHATMDDLMAAADRAVRKGADSRCMESQSGFERPDQSSSQPSTVPGDATQCERLRGSGHHRSAGVDGNRTHFHNQHYSNDLHTEGYGGGAESGAVDAQHSVDDADLAHLITLWQMLADDARQAVLRLAEKSVMPSATH